ncbi:ATP-dependent RNA helicase HrpA [Aliidiomarina halalkaliphila]|uniref:RNA helicase n=1 Tax=Aliidiomarina halalkaliphila TaxID=2593535 RepID=A0A552X4I5_9GAMM|nr:ATP-dependent RNA helicase HrpA [Aliidiomarina halalkaliphila]TRW49829.1 ATP-dependent RNA helicase HrpA [Aliidiomarina halalkaliphila]
MSDLSPKPLRPIEFPAQLPVVAEKERILAAIRDHQVVVLAGETGSGKTTQLPKMLLEMGFAEHGLIGHTQPRRLAARSVAKRIAEELKEPLGQRVGFKIRFQDESSEHTAIKLMTDGILLAEMQRDRLLKRYSAIIIDEAHERSLNIDFLLGVLRQLIDKRPDLKVIITSATIETERFSKHFRDAPVIEVSGRTFPVEVRYQPLLDSSSSDGEVDIYQGICDASAQLMKEGPGDILVFLSGEREIRDSADALREFHQDSRESLEIVPLYARLSANEQNRIFQPAQGRRIVLATNVAETSLTVPGIRYVIDPGTARISRYSYRTKVQRLPIENISQASANQRAGRCGRVGPGICIRLYSEDDYQQRPPFTDPEILRTNLASVILQMATLKLGDIRKFPFLQRPDERFINDGMRLLDELGAMQKGGRKGPRRLTAIGRSLGRLPIDPRLGRMVVAAEDFHSVREVLIITAALSIQDPRERPHDKQQKADELHKRFMDERSDFVAWLKLWNYLQEQQHALSSSQFRKQCKQDFIHYLRVREWQDVYAQLRQSVREQGIRINDEPATYEQIHQAILTGLLSQIGQKDEKHQYVGARQTRFFIFPGSGLFNKKPNWLMSAELVETSKLYGRYVARIEPEWIEPVAQHLVRRNYHEPRYSKKRGAVVATEQVTLYGLLIVPGRTVHYGKVDPVVAREVFIREALVQAQMKQPPAFLQRNLALIQDVRELEEKSRRRDILIDEEALFQAYEAHLPSDIYDDRALLHWLKKSQKADPKVLHFSREQLMQQDATHVTSLDYPDQWVQGRLRLPLTYVFEPGHQDDGVSVDIPLPMLNQVTPVGFDWQVPALREDLVTALIKSLPKQWRRNFVPAPNYARAFLESVDTTLVASETSMIMAMTQRFKRMSGIEVPADAWQLESIPVHLRVNFRVLDEQGQVIARDRDLRHLQQQLQPTLTKTLVETAGDDVEQEGLTDWSFGDAPKPVEKQRGRFSIHAFPALKDEGKSVAIRVFDNQADAERAHRQGLRKLVLLQIPSPVSYLREKLPNKAKLALYFNPWGQVEALIEDCMLAAIDSLIGDTEPRNEDEFRVLTHRIRAELNERTLLIARQVERCLLLSYQVQKQLKGKIPLPLVNSYNDAKAHLQRLIYPGFVSDFGEHRLADTERYLKALAQRVEKLPVDPNKDRLRCLLFEKLEGRWQELLKKIPKGDPVPEGLQDFRWYLEEFRVSTFAQQLGTRFPVSEQRLKQRLDELESELKRV